MPTTEQRAKELLTAGARALQCDDPEYNLKAIEYLDEAATFFTDRASPVEWGLTQALLASALIVAEGDRSVNLRRAIVCAEGAIRVFASRPDAADTWAMAHYNLGTALSEIASDEPQANLAKAIRCFEIAACVLTENRSPAEFAMIQYALGKATKRICAAAASPRLARAIESLEAALLFYSRNQFPLQWADIQSQLGGCWRQVPTSERRLALRKSIECLSSALQVQSEALFPYDWAETKAALGGALSELSTIDLNAGDPQDAVAHYEDALRVYRRDRFPEKWAAVQTEMGNIWIDAAARNDGDSSTVIQRAIEKFQMALQVFTPNRVPFLWAATQHCLGSAYLELADTAAVPSIDKALSSFEKALTVLNEDQFPPQWAMVQNSLGNAWRARKEGQRADNLANAIRHYKAALRVQTEEDSPQEWAQTMSNLGETYRMLRTGDPIANLHQAIECQENALRVISEPTAPSHWARIQNNLGAAWSELPISNDGRSLKNAIRCFRMTLRVYRPNRQPDKWARTYNNLGVAWRSTPLGNRDLNTKRAIVCFRRALKVYTREKYPFYWAGTNHNLALAWAQLPSGDRTENQRRAVAHHELAQTVQTEEAFSYEWALTMSSLGDVLDDHPARSAADVRRAIECYRSALRVFTSDVFPRECRQTLNRLSKLLYREGDWMGALEASAKEADVVAQLERDSTDEDRCGQLIATAVPTYDRAVLAAYRAGKHSACLELTEGGKTRSLSNHLWRRDVRPTGVSSEEWLKYHRLREDAAEAARSVIVAVQSDRVQEPAVANRAQRFQVLERITELRNAARRMESTFQARDPDYVPFAPTLKTEEIQYLCRLTQAVIISFRVTDEGTLVSLVGPGDGTGAAPQVTFLPELTNTRVRGFLAKWLTAYYNQNTTQVIGPWFSFVDQACNELHEMLMKHVGAMVDASPHKNIRRLVIIPSQGLSLLPLHAAWWIEGQTRRYLTDEREIVFAPSCQVLSRCLARRKSVSTEPTSLFAVQNPDGTLQFTDWEVDGIKTFFRGPQIRKGPRATRAEVLANAGAAEELYFSCHGLFDMAAPEKSHLRLHGADRLFRNEIVGLDLRKVRLAVLSACETGLSDVNDRADEYIGLSSAFLAGGALSVVPTLWAVWDFSTALLIRRFHANLYERHSPPALALSDAQKWLRTLTYDDVATILLQNQPMLSDAAIAQAKGFVSRLRQAGPPPSASDLPFVLAELGERPFSNPVFWAAFQCVGAGW